MKIELLTWNDPIPEWVPEHHHRDIRRIIGYEDGKTYDYGIGSVLVILIGDDFEYFSDRGEPEDNTFHRDYSWIPRMLKKAFEEGQRAQT